MSFSAAWQQVTCKRCRRQYQCTPADDYWALPQKVRMALRWGLEQMEPDGSWTFDYFFKCDRDTFIHADRLLSSMQEHFDAGDDYVGLVGKLGDCCGGGAGYILSRHAVQTYLDNYDERQLNLTGWTQLEDWCLFRTLDRANPRISPVCDRRYWDLRLGPVPDPATNITWNPWKP